MAFAHSFELQPQIAAASPGRAARLVVAVGCICAALAATTVPKVNAAVPVEEAIPSPQDRSSTAYGVSGSAADSAPPVRTRPTLAPLSEVDAPPEAGGAGGLAPGTLVYDFQLLQEEVQSLRGIVEEQANTIERLQAEQTARYLELDQRLQALVSGGMSTGAGTTRSDDASSAAAFPAATPSGNVAASEQAAYQAAYGLLQARRFGEAISAFDSFIQKFPSGQYTPNALYWLGELHLVSEPPNLEQARQSLVQVLRLFPDHPKVPDALYKLGVIYDSLGDGPQARAYLQQVLSEYPQAPVARKATSLLREMDTAANG